MSELYNDFILKDSVFYASRTTSIAPITILKNSGKKLSTIMTMYLIRIHPA